MMKTLILILTLILTLNFFSTSYADSDTLAEKEAKKADKLQKKQEKAVKKAAKKANIKTVELWANAGDVQAQMIMSYAHRHGLSVDRDLKLSAEWKAKAEKTNPAYVENFEPIEFYGKKIQLARLYGIAAYRAQVGYYVKPDYEAALRWAELGEAEQDTMSLAFMGSAYYTGRGVRQDYKTAIDYFKKSQEESLSLTLLSDAYAKGHGVEKDMHKSKLYADYLTLINQEKAEKQRQRGEKSLERAKKSAERANAEYNRKNPFAKVAEKEAQKLAAEKERIEIEAAKQAAAEKNALLKAEAEGKISDADKIPEAEQKKSDADKIPEAEQKKSDADKNSEAEQKKSDADKNSEAEQKKSDAVEEEFFKNAPEVDEPFSKK